MSKTKSDKIPHYELLYLVSNQFSEDEVKPIMEKVNSLVTGNQGEITSDQKLGKKRLAYPIKGFRYGYYNLLEFNMPGKNLAKIDRAMRLMSEILRQQIVAKTLKSQVEIEQDKKIAAKIAARNLKEEKESKEKISPRDGEPAAKDKKAGREKVDLKGLDEKLDKILETDDLL